MAKVASKRVKHEEPTPQVPFNEALKRVWNAPPQHKTAKPSKQKKRTGK